MGRCLKESFRIAYRIRAHRHIYWRILHLSKLDIKFGNLIWIANLRTVLPHIEFHILTIEVGIRRSFWDGRVERFPEKLRTNHGEQYLYPHCDAYAIFISLNAVHTIGMVTMREIRSLTAWQISTPNSPK